MQRLEVNFFNVLHPYLEDTRSYNYKVADVIIALLNFPTLSYSCIR